MGFRDEEMLDDLIDLWDLADDESVETQPKKIPKAVNDDAFLQWLQSEEETKFFNQT